MQDRLTITEVAKDLGVTPRTIMRWEKAGRIKKAKRDWRGWRFYIKEELMEIKEFYESAYDYDVFDKSVVSNAAKDIISTVLVFAIVFSSAFCTNAFAVEQNLATQQGIKESRKTVDITLDELPAINTPVRPSLTDAVKYTLGPDDVISIEVRRHPEFSGEYAVNSEGKIEYKYIGDVIVSDMNKTEVKDLLNEILSEYIIDPDVDVQIVSYLSKVFYVVGDVNRPGKFYMKGDTVTVREALVQAGLPTYAAAMRRCRIITPNEANKDNYVNVNVYSLLYEGDLRQNFVMKPGEVLYVPATVIAKVIRIISPVTDMATQAAGTAARGAAMAAAAL